jgi:hypothetical protein
MAEREKGEVLGAKSEEPEAKRGTTKHAKDTKKVPGPASYPGTRLAGNGR